MKNNTDNLKIVERLLELAKNPLEYNLFPKDSRKEYIFLANALNDSVKRLEHEFDNAFRYALGQYKNSLEENKGYGWFHAPEKLIYIKMQINQLLYAIYGSVRDELVFNKSLKEGAYLDLINQIDRTVLMTPEEKQAHNEEINRLSKEILEEILAESKK